MLTHKELREKYVKYFENKGHIKIDNASLVLQNDATTLFTSSGMQPLVPYLLGKKHERGTRLVDIQPCVRTVDIDEVGNNRHLTYFEMIGNWSLGDYFKDEQLPWCWEFFTGQVGLDPSRLFVTVFEGGYGIPPDTESEDIWKKLGVADNKIFSYGTDKNWWSRSGPPDAMPEGEIGGPSSEIFYDFGLEHDSAFGPVCHPNCDCGRFIEIGNSVFIQYKKEADGTLSELPQKNVDFGGGLERILAASNNNPDVYVTDAFKSIVTEVESLSGKKYSDAQNMRSMRIIVDHLKAACFLVSQGVVPSNKEHGYIVRRLIRRSVVKMVDLDLNVDKSLPRIVKVIKQIYSDSSFGLKKEDVLTSEIGKEADNFERVMKRAYVILVKEKPTAPSIYNLEQSNGLPVPLSLERLNELGIKYDENILEEIEKLRLEHREKSRSASKGMFQGGLANHSEQVVKYHTATHLIHKALQEVLGEDVRQEGSNITGERLRFDFYSPIKPTREQEEEIEKKVNQKINEKLSVFQLTIPKNEAEQMGAMSFFKEKYPDMVSVYFIGGDPQNPEGAYSKEFCGGPHVSNTFEIGTMKIDSIKKIGANILRLYASKA